MYFGKKKISFFLALSFLSTTAFNQVTDADNCVDYDIAAYPKVINGTSYNWNSAEWNFTNLKENKITGINIGGTGYFKGLLEYKPASYSLPANSSKEYPVIIFFHGFGSRGEGTIEHLCRLFKDRGSDLATHLAIPGRVESTPGLFTQTFGGVTYEYLVISPQFNQYTRLDGGGAPDHFPSFNEVDDIIDYVESHYRVDPRRIYLTGLSNGANIITEYVGSSLARAKRVAAIMPVALCSQLNHVNNTSRGISASYIGQAKLKTWFVYCEVDNCGAPGPIADNDKDVPVDWYNAIKAVPGHEVPRFTVLKNQNPATLYNCSDTLLHDAWSRAYDPNFKASFVNGTGANDGINKNMYEWFTEQVNAVLPVKLKSYTARLANDKVEIKWVTTDEKDNASFTIERAGADQQFKAIGVVPGALNNKGEKDYEFTDNNPLADLSFYRLVQNDVDGEKNYFEIKRIINQKNKKSLVIISPNPVAASISAFVSVDKTQKVSLSLTDMTGKIIRSVNGVYSEGSTEVKISANDLSKGVYLLKASGENFNSTQRILKK